MGSLTEQQIRHSPDYIDEASVQSLIKNISVAPIHNYKTKNASCEIEDFIETHLCKLRGILRSRILPVLCDVIKNVRPC